MTSLLLNRTHYPVRALGPGNRAGIWVQGCTIGCDGCVARDTWPASGTSVEVSAVLGWLSSLPGDVDGVTISGGEPFQQPEAVTELLEGVHEWRGDRPVDILAYSGYPISRLRRNAATDRMLSLCDAVMAGPYVQSRPTDLPLRGSANQRLVALTDLGRERYEPVPADPGTGRVQACLDGDRIWFIGIPRPGDMERTVERLSTMGVTFDRTTWSS